MCRCCVCWGGRLSFVEGRALAAKIGSGPGSAGGLYGTADMVA